MTSSVSSSFTGHAKLGRLYVKLVLDSPKRVHYGSNEMPVCGSVLLKHLPMLRGLPHSPLNAELFGPLQIQVTLRGFARINHDDETRAEVIPLVKETVTIHDGPFRASANEESRLPFSIKFPAHTIPRSNTAGVAVRAEDGSWNFQERATSVEIEPLPPSCQVSGKHDSWRTLGSTNVSSVMKTAISIEYSVEAVARMPGIEVEIVNAYPHEVRHVLYDQPRIAASAAIADQSLTSDVSHTFTIQDEGLRPSHEQPHGFRNKTKALLKPTDPPKFVFETDLIGIPQHAYVDQPLSFVISIIPHDSSTTTVTPKIFLDSCTITLVAHTTGLQPTVIELLKTKEAEFSSAKPFSEEHGWTKAIDIGHLSWVPSTFTFRNISRTYKLRIAVHFSVGAQKVKTSRDVPLVIHPPVEIETARTETAEESDGLPSYHEATHDPADELGEVPSYEQVVSAPYHRPHNPAPTYSDHNIGFASVSVGC